MRQMVNALYGMEDDVMANRRTRMDWRRWRRTFEETGHRTASAPVRLCGYFNCWMTLAWSGAHFPDAVYRPSRQARRAMDRMLETMQLGPCLEVEQRHLVWMRAGIGWQIIRRFALRPPTAWRRWKRPSRLVDASTDTACLVAHNRSSRQVDWHLADRLS